MLFSQAVRASILKNFNHHIQDAPVLQVAQSYCRNIQHQCHGWQGHQASYLARNTSNAKGTFQGLVMQPCCPRPSGWLDERNDGIQQWMCHDVNYINDVSPSCLSSVEESCREAPDTLFGTVVWTSSSKLLVHSHVGASAGTNPSFRARALIAPKISIRSASMWHSACSKEKHSICCAILDRMRPHMRNRTAPKKMLSKSTDMIAITPMALARSITRRLCQETGTKNSSGIRKAWMMTK